MRVEDGDQVDILRAMVSGKVVKRHTGPRWKRKNKNGRVLYLIDQKTE